MTRRRKDSRTEKEERFIQAFEGDGTKAAIAAGYKPSSAARMASRLLKRPDIKAAIDRKIDLATKESAKRLSRKIDFGRNDIIMWLADIARGGESESARASAGRTLAEIFQLLPKGGTSAVDFFAGWNEQELEYYRRTNGEIPPSRLGLSAEVTNNANDTSKPGPSAGTLASDSRSTVGRS